MYNKQHLISLLGYIGIGFIGGSISHGFFSGTRSVVMAILGIILFIISEYLQEGEKNYGHLIIGGLIYSIAVGMISGGFQHFLDSPERSLRIIPIGRLISTAIFPYKEGLIKYNFIKSFLLGVLISIGLFILAYTAMHVVPKDFFVGGDHHGGVSTVKIQDTSTIDITNNNGSTITDTDHH